MKVITLDDLQSGFTYLVENPSFFLRSLINVARMRIGVPLSGVHWLLEKASRGRLPSDMHLEAVPPGLRVSATANVMGTELFVSAVLTVEHVLLGVDSLRLSLRVRDLVVRPPADSPLVSMLSMMDLSKPGDLLAFLPMKPPIILSAQGDLFVLDLLKLPKLARNLLARRVVAALSEVLAVKELATEDDLLVLGLRAIPLGFMAALGHLREA